MAGVSISTTSRVLNEHPDVGSETRSKVLDIIKHYNYTPNGNAKNLKQSKSKSIACIVKGSNNILFHYAIRNIQKKIEKTNYSPIISYIEQNDNELLFAEQVYAEKKPKGIIFLGADIKNFEYYFAIEDIPCVIITTSAEGIGYANLSSLSVNDFLGGYIAADYLIKMGHKKIAIIGADFSSLVEERFEGALKRMSEDNITFDKQLYVNGKFAIDTAFEETKKLIDSKTDFTAVFAMSDLMAAGAAKAIFNYGLKIPDDISLIGFDGTFMAKYYNPTITTIKQPIRKMCDDAIRILLDAIAHQREIQPPRHILYNLEIIEGGSIKNINI